MAGQPDEWPFRTRKLNAQKWQAPSNDATLSLEILCLDDNQLQIELDGYLAAVDLKGKPEWQNILLRPVDFRLKDDPKHEGKHPVLPSWNAFEELVLGPGKLHADGHADTVGWEDQLPAFRNLSWKL